MGGGGNLRRGDDELPDVGACSVVCQARPLRFGAQEIYSLQPLLLVFRSSLAPGGKCASDLLLPRWRRGLKLFLARRVVQRHVYTAQNVTDSDAGRVRGRYGYRVWELWRSNDEADGGQWDGGGGLAQDFRCKVEVLVHCVRGFIIQGVLEDAGSEVEVQLHASNVRKR